MSLDIYFLLIKSKAKIKAVSDFQLFIMKNPEFLNYQKFGIFHVLSRLFTTTISS